MITWDRLRIFAVLAEYASVGAAAAALHLTGPAVSQQVRKLEREAGCRLVEPDGRGIRLTPAGHVLATHAREVGRRVADAERDLAEIHGLVAGPLRIGSISSALWGVVSGALRAVLAAHERVVPTIRNGEMFELVPALAGRELDVAVIDSWIGTPARLPPGVRVTTLLREDVRIAVPEGHRLADRDVLRLAELDGEVWTSCPAGTGEHDAVLFAMREQGIEAALRYRVGDYSAQLALVAAGLALAAVPRLGRFPPYPGVRFVPSEPELFRDVLVLTNAETETPAVRAFLAALLSETGATVEEWDRDRTNSSR